MAFTAKIAKVPGLIKEVALENGATVAQALEAAGISADGFTIQVSGQNASLDTVVTANATVMLTQRIKGNTPFTVKVAKVPGLIKEVAVEAGATVADALEAAEISAEGFTIQVSGQTACDDTVLSPNATVMLTQRIKGNTTLTVKVAKVPGMIKEVVIEEGSTVGDAIAAAEISADGFSIQVNGSSADMDTVIEGNTTIMLTQRIKGNSGHRTR